MRTLGRRGFLGALVALAAMPLVPAAVRTPDPMDELLAVQQEMLKSIEALCRSFGTELPDAVQRYIDAGGGA